jgi:hypothetical protein
MRDETLIDEQEADEMHEAMDYAQHEKTWEGVTNLVKWAIIQLAFIVVGLFCVIQGGVPGAGAAADRGRSCGAGHRDAVRAASAADLRRSRHIHGQDKGGSRPPFLLSNVCLAAETARIGLLPYLRQC